MIPVYLVLLIGIILFLITGSRFNKRRKDAVIEMKKGVKIRPLVSFVISMACIIVSAVVMHDGGIPDTASAKKILSTTLKESDVRYVSGKSLIRTLADDTEEIKKDGIIEYTDTIYNKAKVSTSDVISFSDTEDIPSGQVKIDKCLAKIKNGPFFMLGIRYKIQFGKG